MRSMTRSIRIPEKHPHPHPDHIPEKMHMKGGEILV
jgi:hypothetical protein